MMDGHGKLWFASGDRYEGDFKVSFGIRRARRVRPVFDAATGRRPEAHGFLSVHCYAGSLFNSG